MLISDNFCFVIARRPVKRALYSRNLRSVFLRDYLNKIELLRQFVLSAKYTVRTQKNKELGWDFFLRDEFIKKTTYFVTCYK